MMVDQHDGHLFVARATMVAGLPLQPYILVFSALLSVFQSGPPGPPAFWKRVYGPKLDGPEHFQKNCQNVPGAAGAAAGAAAASAAASAVCIYYVVIGGRFAPPYKYVIKYMQQKQQLQQQQQQQQQHL